MPTHQKKCNLVNKRMRMRNRNLLLVRSNASISNQLNWRTENELQYKTGRIKLLVDVYSVCIQQTLNVVVCACVRNMIRVRNCVYELMTSNHFFLRYPHTHMLKRSHCRGLFQLFLFHIQSANEKWKKKNKKKIFDVSYENCHGAIQRQSKKSIFNPVMCDCLV